ncbi:MAG: hypothetical protein PUK66_07095 [Bacteroidales bacterium]|nr:hypothetical protein [Porphyromonas sp.]MDD7438577.1 hypothetical protein [Bacteroidales bacterium]
MAHPMALLLLEDLDQPYTDCKSVSDDEDTPLVVYGATSLRNLLGTTE